MKLSKALGFGLFLHVLLIAVLIIQPSCTTMQAPTQTYEQSGGLETLPTSDPTNILTKSQSSDLSLDGAFNAGSGNRYTSDRPGSEFSEFENITPKLSPLSSNMDASTVEIAGPSFKIHTVRKGDSLWAISKRYSVSLDEVYAANGLNKGSVLSIGQQIKIPAEGSTATIRTVTADTYQPSGYNMDSKTYAVVRGDTLSGIAKRFNTSVSLIKAANNKTSDKILVGEKLTIPVDGSTSVSPAPKASTSPSVMSSTRSSRVHVVKVGEYPATIARQYGISTQELLAINGITDPRAIQVGQKLKVGSAGGTSTSISPTPKAPVVIPTKPAAKPVSSTAKSEPLPIRIVEADPLVESELDEIDPDKIFDDVDEIPVVPLEE